MAAANTTDTRVHVMGDLYMMTGTFTDGGIDVYYGDHLTNILAAGGHITSLHSTGVVSNAAYAVGDTALVAKTVDKRLVWNVGETLYGSTGIRLGVITALAADATGITIGGGVLSPIAEDDVFYKLGPEQPSVTLIDGQLNVSIDETNSYVVFSTGNITATGTGSNTDGRWWILGNR